MQQWHDVRLRDCVSILGDGLHGTPAYTPNGDYAFINGNNLSSGRITIKEDTKRVTVDEYEKYKKDLNDRTILVSINGTIGNVALYRGEKCILGKSACYLNVTKEYSRKFIYYILKHSHFQDYIASVATGTTIKNISLKQMREYEFLCPSRTEQERITRILSAIDDKIELNAQINHNLEEQAKAIFKSWFVDFEPFQNGKFVDSELGPIPEGWRIGTLKDIAAVTMGQSPRGESYNESGDGCIFFQGRAEFSDRFPTRRLFTTEPKKMAEAGDVLLSVRAPVGDMNLACEKCCIGRGLAAIHAKNNWQSFVFYSMMGLKAELDMYNGEGTVFGCINRDALNNMKLIIPANPVIAEFEAMAVVLDKKYYLNYEESRRLTQLRDSLLPKLMSGEINVSEVQV